MLLRITFLAVLCLCLAACGKDRALSRGAALYAQNCVICHGGDLRGGGGAAVEGLGRTPSDLTILTQAAGGVFPSDMVLALLQNYASGTQAQRRMRPFVHLTSDKRTRVRTDQGRQRVPTPQADLLAYIEAAQRP